MFLEPWTKEVTGAQAGLPCLSLFTLHPRRRTPALVVRAGGGGGDGVSIPTNHPVTQCSFLAPLKSLVMLILLTYGYKYDKFLLYSYSVMYLHS